MTYVKTLPFKFDIKKLCDTSDSLLANYDDNEYGYNRQIEEYSKESSTKNSLQYINLMMLKGLDTGNGVTDEKNCLKNGAFTKTFDKTEGTYFEEVVTTLSSMYLIGRILLYEIKPNSVLPKHIDTYPKVSIAIMTNSNCITSIFNSSGEKPVSYTHLRAHET